MALIAAKTVVGIRVENGSMAKPAPKPTTSGQRPLRELIANDSGRTDLVDLQYVALSAVTMLYVVLFFVSDVGGGLPRLPAEIWALTGAPAGAYLVNKMATRANPVITCVTVAGTALVVEGGGFGPEARIEIDSTALAAEYDPATGTLAAQLPATAPATFTVVVSSAACAATRTATRPRHRHRLRLRPSSRRQPSSRPPASARGAGSVTGVSRGTRRSAGRSPRGASPVRSAPPLRRRAPRRPARPAGTPSRPPG